MRGSTPLDVAAASVMDNNELALALREPDLEKVSREKLLFRPLCWSDILYISIISLKHSRADKSESPITLR